MPRSFAFLIVALALVIGAIVLLSGRATKQPTHIIEADVTANAAG